MMESAAFDELLEDVDHAECVLGIDHAGVTTDLHGLGRQYLGGYPRGVPAHR